MTLTKTFSLAVIAMLLQACGQSGALYLPDNNPQAIPASKQEPQ